MCRQDWTTLTKQDLRGVDRDARDLILEIMAAGGDGRRTRNGHVQVRVNGTLLVLAGTGSDSRGIKNARAAVRRAMRVAV